MSTRPLPRPPLPAHVAADLLRAWGGDRVWPRLDARTPVGRKFYYEVTITRMNLEFGGNDVLGRRWVIVDPRGHGGSRRGRCVMHPHPIDALLTEASALAILADTLDDDDLRDQADDCLDAAGAMLAAAHTDSGGTVNAPTPLTALTEAHSALQEAITATSRPPGPLLHAAVEVADAREAVEDAMNSEAR